MYMKIYEIWNKTPQNTSDRLKRKLENYEQ